METGPVHAARAYLTRQFDKYYGLARRDRLKRLAREGLRQYLRTDLRWSYLAIGGMVLLGVAVNLLLPHGWTIWPLVMAGGIMLMVHEAAERNGQGLPPLHVYAFFVSAMIVWLAFVVVLSAVNPLIVLAGMLTLLYYGGRGYIQQRQRRRLIAGRRAAGRCIHCGAPARQGWAVCPSCGREPDPDDALLKRVGGVPRSAQSKARARAALTPERPTASAAQKEQALLARRHRRRQPPRAR